MVGNDQQGTTVAGYLGESAVGCTASHPFKTMGEGSGYPSFQTPISPLKNHPYWIISNSAGGRFPAGIIVLAAHEMYIFITHPGPNQFDILTGYKVPW